MTSTKVQASNSVFLSIKDRADIFSAIAAESAILPLLRKSAARIYPDYEKRAYASSAGFGGQ